jgi:hypothetical protein
MANRKPLSVVYPNLVALGDDHRLQPHVSWKDCSQIVAVSGTTSILHHICQQAIKTAAEYVRLHKLDFTTSERLYDFLRERSVVTPPATETPAQDVAGRDTRGGEQAPAVTDNGAVVGKGVKTRRRGKEGKGGE